MQENAKKLNKTDPSLDKNGLLRFKNRLYVPNSADLKSTILDELHQKAIFLSPMILENDNNLKKIVLLA